MPTLTTKILNSLGWVFSNMAAVNGIQFARNVILWYFLVPGEFGLNSMAWIVISGMNLLTDMGFTQALIQRRKDLPEAISVAWYANVLIHGTIYVAIVLAAPFAAAHFGEPQLTSILRIAALSVLIRCIGTTNFALMRKNFEFKSILIADATEAVVLTVSQIGMAMAGYGVWSLVIGNMIGVASQSAALCWLHPIRVGKPSLRVAREMLHFGWHMTLSTVLLWLIKNMDYYFVGKFLGKTALGFYQLAFRLSNMISTNVTKMLGSVLFPAFSEIGTDLTRVRNAWFRAARYTMVLIMPLGVGMIVFATELTLGFYRTDCEVTIAPLAILTVFALCRALGTTLSDLAKGVGKPWVLSQVAFWHVVIMAPLLFLLVNSIRPGGEALIAYWGLEPVGALIVRFFVALNELRIGILLVSVGVSSVALFAITMTLHLCGREVKLTARFALRALQPSLVAALGMAASGWLAKEGIYLVASPTRIVWLAVLVVAGGFSCVVYGAILWFCYREVFTDLKGMLAKRSAEGGRKRARGIKPPTLVG